MNLISEHQIGLCRSMLDSINHFRSGEIKFYDLVNMLEAAIQAGEFKDSTFVEMWYDLWTPLEIVRAQVSGDVPVSDVDKYLIEMESFLNSINGIKEINGDRLS